VGRRQERSAEREGKRGKKTKNFGRPTPQAGRNQGSPSEKKRGREAARTQREKYFLKKRPEPDLGRHGEPWRKKARKGGEKRGSIERVVQTVTAEVKTFVGNTRKRGVERVRKKCPPRPEEKKRKTKENQKVRILRGEMVCFS